MDVGCGWWMWDGGTCRRIRRGIVASFLDYRIKEKQSDLKTVLLLHASTKYLLYLYLSDISNMTGLPLFVAERCPLREAKSHAVSRLQDPELHVQTACIIILT